MKYETSEDETLVGHAKLALPTADQEAVTSSPDEGTTNLQLASPNRHPWTTLLAPGTSTWETPTVLLG